MRTVTAAARRRNSFSRQHGSTFACSSCGRQTRHTGAQSVGVKLCGQCYELAGIENEISDGHATIDDRASWILALVAEIESKGGRGLDAWSGLVSRVHAAHDEAAEGRDNGAPVVDDRDTGDRQADDESPREAIVATTRHPGDDVIILAPARVALAAREAIETAVEARKADALTLAQPTGARTREAATARRLRDLLLRIDGVARERREGAIVVLVEQALAVLDAKGGR